MKGVIKQGLILMAVLILSVNSFAGEVFLKNGDKISGTVVEDTYHQVTIDTEAMGEITIAKEFVDKVVTEEQMAAEEPPAPPPEEEYVEWTRKITLGYTQSGGNTDDSSFAGELFISQKTEDDERTAKITSFISTTNDELDARKYYGMLRYAINFGYEKEWFNFYKIEWDQDRFANIDYRVTPSAGIGYWFSDEEDYKLLAEAALGWGYTKYYDGTESEGEMVLIPRGYFFKKIYGELAFIEDVTLYPSLEDFNRYRIHSETSLTQPISDNVAWKLSFIDDYNSSPSGSSKKNDYKLISSIDYNF